MDKSYIGFQMSSSNYKALDVLIFVQKKVTINKISNVFDQWPHICLYLLFMNIFQSVIFIARLMPNLK